MSYVVDFNLRMPASHAELLLHSFDKRFAANGQRLRPTLLAPGALRKGVRDPLPVCRLELPDGLKPA